MPLKRWIPPCAGAQDIRRLCQQMKIPPLVGKILLARGISDTQQADEFLHAPRCLYDPFLMRDMEKAVAIIEDAVQAQRLIVIYGDYDCDGITSTVLLYQCLEQMGAQVAYYIPEREEGYGLNRAACDAMKQSGAQLCITVDNGITAFEEVQYLQSIGIPVVITDHHQPRETLPDAQAILNPHRADDTYPFEDLAGVGVAFKLVCALEGDCECADTLEKWGDIVCLGTVADVVPLRGENRAIVKAGLQVLERSENPGVLALLAVAGLADKPLTAESVSFGLAPRLNAASRMGCCEKSVDLLLCGEPPQAADLADEVDKANRSRKQLEGGIMQDIERQLAQSPALMEDRILVLAGEGWHHGIIGIAASRVMERFGRPCILIAIEGEQARGSARSVAGFSIIDALGACAPLLTKFGGHTMAAGFSLLPQDISRLRREINDYAASACPVMPAPALRLDALLEAQELDVQALRHLSDLEPFGAENELPLFLIQNVRLDEITPIGDGRHLRLRVNAGGRSVQAVYFGMTPGRFPFSVGDKLDIAANVSVDAYQGQERVSVKVRDIRPAGFAQDDYFSDLSRVSRFWRGEEIGAGDARALIPDRGQIALLYRTIRTGVQTDDPDFFFLRFQGKGISCARAHVALRVLREAGLVDSKDGRFAVLPAAQKADLEKTAVMARLRGLAT